MIDHRIIISGPANPIVSKHVISCSVQQSIENDSDPGKLTVVLANPDQIYTDIIVPQLDIMDVYLSNFVYSTKHEWHVAFGHVTDVTCPTDETTVKGECDLGHLADALSTEYNFDKNELCKDILLKVLGDHKPEYASLLDFEINPDIRVDPVSYDSTNTYQDVLEDIRGILGAVFYFDWDGRLKFRDPRAITAYVNLDPFVSQPTRARSIMGYCNVLRVVAYSSLSSDEEGAQTADSNPITINRRDEDDIKLRGEIVAPTHFAYNIHTEDDANEAADKLEEFYRKKKDTLTEVVIEGIIPPLQSLVTYTSFEDPDGNIDQKMLFGLVIERKIEYSIDGLQTTISIHPRDNIADVLQDLYDLLGEPIAQGQSTASPLTDTDGNLLSDLYNWLKNNQPDPENVVTF